MSLPVEVVPQCCMKKVELQTELAMKTPDAKKAITMHMEISKLESKLNWKRLIHMSWKTKTRFNAYRK